MATIGCIVIADITGYTAYLKGSELEHAEDSLRSLLEVLIEHTKPPLVISRLEGDAVISYAPQASFLQGQTLVELLENSYVAFRQARERMRLNTTCTCNACQNIPNLDLKFFLHHGTYILQQMPSYTELVGNDVNVAHRLTKNRIKEALGLRAYAAYTAQAIEALQLEEFAAGLQMHREDFPDVGEVQLFVQDLQPVWEREHELRRTVVEPDEAGFTVEVEIPVPPPLAWDFFTKPEYRQIMTGADGMPVENQTAGRTGSGTVYVCAHGDVNLPQPVLDWRPFEYYTYETPMPMGLACAITIRFAPIDDGRATRVTGFAGKPHGSVLPRLIVSLPVIKNKIVASTEANWQTLRQRIMQELESGVAVRAEAASVDPEQVGAAIQSSLAESAAG